MREAFQCGLYQHPPKECHIPKCPFCSESKPMSIDWTKPVETSDGILVRVLCTDAGGDVPVVYLIPDACNGSCMNTGRCDLSGVGHYPWNNYRLRNRKIKKEGWVNLYTSTSKRTMLSAYVYSTKEQALGEVAGIADYITTTKIEWEE